MKKTNMKDVHAISKVNITVTKKELAVLTAGMIGITGIKEFEDVVRRIWTEEDVLKATEVFNNVSEATTEEQKDIISHLLATMRVFID